VEGILGPKTEGRVRQPSPCWKPDRLGEGKSRGSNRALVLLAVIRSKPARTEARRLNRHLRKLRRPGRPHPRVRHALAGAAVEDAASIVRSAKRTRLVASRRR
jgi:hypothetical protein